ncbi:MAG: DUF6468 domain-containing protein [Pseudomonadota bacterium]
MTGLSLGMAIEALVALLLLMTIGYCVTLNRRLQRLRADEEMLRATISELLTATEIAERAILGLKATAGDCEKTVSARLAEAEHVTARLGEQIEAGEAVFIRIARLAEAARPAPPASRSAETPASSTVVPPAMVGGGGKKDAPGDNPAPSSSARSLKDAAAAAALRVQNLRRLTGDQAA